MAKKRKRSNTTKEKCWESDLAITDDDKCHIITKLEKPIIVMPHVVWRKIVTLTKAIDTEWLGYLKASLVQTGEWKIIDIVVPKQEVTSTTVKPTDTIPAEGVIHSHVDMGAFFSGVDDSYLNQNHQFSIVVNKREEVKAVSRIELPCGAFAIVDAELQIEYPEYEDAQAFIEEAKKNIEEERVKTYVQSYKPGQVWRPGQGWTDPPRDDTQTTVVDEDKKNDTDTGVGDYEPKKKEKKKPFSAWDPADQSLEDFYAENGYEWY